jgi:hypothetical protein
MANAGVPSGKKSEGMGVGVGSKVNTFTNSDNEIGIPAGQSPGFGKGNKEISMNQLPSNSKVIFSAKSSLMEDMSQYRGPEQKGSGQ